MTRIKHEPAVLIGFLATLLSEVTVAVDPGMRWPEALLAAVPVVVGIITRQFVSPAPPPKP